MFKGYAARYNSQSSDLGGFREVLAAGAFERVLSKRSKADVTLLYNHNADNLLARTLSGTLRLSSDDRGLKFDADPPSTQLARDLEVLIRRGDLTGASFAFTVAPGDESWGMDERGQTTRTIKSVNALYDVSIVTTPAYPSASVGMRSLEQWRQARALMAPSDDEGGAAGLVMSLDYDNTFAAAPGLWLSFAYEACEAGNTVVMISRREDTPENRAEIEAAIGTESYISQIILCGPDSSKRDAAAAAGIAVDIWIDDTPSTVDAASTTRSLVRIGSRLAASRALALQLRHRIALLAGGKDA